MNPGLKNALRALEVFSPRPKAFSKRFDAYLTKHWLVPPNSPLLLKGSSLSAADERKLLAFFKAQQGKHKFASNEPYFCSERKAIKAPGWSLSNSYQVCEWNKRRLPILKAGFSYVCGDYYDKKLVADSERVMQAAFKTPAGFFERANSTITTMKPRTNLVVIYKRGKPVAAGAVTWNKSHALMFSGSVIPRHQGSGLWRDLLALRQAQTPPTVGTWMMTTANPRIRSKADRHYEISVFKQDP